MILNNSNEFERKFHYLEEIVIKKTETVNKIINDWKDDMKSHIKQIQCEDKLRKNLEQAVIAEQCQIVITQEDGNELEQQILYLKQLEAKEAGLKKDVGSMELKLSNSKKLDLEKSVAQNEVIQKYRDFCKASKELTKTTFNYHSSNVTGVILNKPEPMQVFNLNPKELNSENITKYLWKCMALASGENWSAVINKN